MFGNYYFFRSLLFLNTNARLTIPFIPAKCSQPPLLDKQFMPYDFQDFKYNVCYKS